MAILDWIPSLLLKNNAQVYDSFRKDVPIAIISLLDKKKDICILHRKVYTIFHKVFKLEDEKLIKSVIYYITNSSWLIVI